MNPGLVVSWPCFSQSRLASLRSSLRYEADLRRILNPKPHELFDCPESHVVCDLVVEEVANQRRPRTHQPVRLEDAGLLEVHDRLERSLPDQPECSIVSCTLQRGDVVDAVQDQDRPVLGNDRQP